MICFRMMLCVAVWMPAIAFCESPQWNRFRGPNGGGVVSADLPTRWSDDENVRWVTPLPGRGSSSPVVWGDRIFLTSYTGYGIDPANPGDRENLRLHVLCLSLTTGEMIWDRELMPAPDEQPMTKRVAEHGYASPTPCVDKDFVFAYFGPSGLVALSHEGDVLWRRDLGDKTAGFGAAASPMMFQDTVIMNASIEDESMYCLDKATGEIRWKQPQIDRTWTTPTLVHLPDESIELVVNTKEDILGLSPDSGQQLWSCYGIQDYIVPCVLADGPTLYCSGGRSNHTVKMTAGGRGDVSDTHLAWDVPRGANVTTPVLVNGYLFWSHDKAIALCLRASDGEEMYRERMPTRSRVYASIVSDGKKLFLTTRDRGVLVLPASPEYQELAINRLGEDDERFNATPAIANHQLLLRSDRRLYCIGRAREL